MAAPYEGEDTPTQRMQPSAGDATQRMEPLQTASPRDQNEVATRYVSSNANSAPGRAFLTGPLGFLAPGEVLGGDCVVTQTHFNHESSRPGLFECQSPEGHVMVKIAASDYPPQPDLWEKLALLQHPNVLRIYRALEMDGRFLEVQEFCEGGTLTDYVPSPDSGRPIPPVDWVEKVLVPSFHSGISYLHAQGIVHRDIKPSNLYLRETNGRKTLVIGDFDISSVLQTGRTSRSTQRLAGTWIYSAPEAFPRFVDDAAAKLGAAVVRSSDYYSFGVVIVELLLGTTSLHQAQLPDLYDFYLQNGRVEVPSDLSPRLTELLHGLLCRNRHRRWGGEEVARWIKGQTTEEDRKRIVEDRGYQLGRSHVAFNAFESSKPTSLPELEQAMVAEPKVAIEELLAGDIMLNWIGSLDSRIARSIRQDREKWRTQPRVALLCARLRINPAASLSVDENSAASTAAEWFSLAQTAVSKGTVSIAQLCLPTRLAELETWLRLKASPEPECADAVTRINLAQAFIEKGPKARTEQVETKAAALVLEEIGYAFLPHKQYLLAPKLTAQTPSEIARRSLDAEGTWTDKPPPIYLASFKRWQDGHLEAYLRQRLVSGPEGKSPLLDQIRKAREDFPENPFIAFEVILRLLDPELPSLQIEFDQRALENLFEIPYGASIPVSIPCRALGAGMPFAAVRMQTQWDAVQLETREITYRRGEIKLRVHSQADLPVGREFQATLSLSGQTTKLAGDHATLRYRVNYPRSLTVKRVWAGACCGAAIFGGARLAIMPVMPQAVRLEHASLLGSNSWYAILAVLCVAFYGAFRLWLWALVRLAR